jgi:putative hydrolase of the HAD superfamily
MSADLAHIDSWLFDLDNTLYPRDCGFMEVVESRMTGVVARLTGLPYDEAFAAREKYLREHGTTLAGLMLHHDVHPQAFLDEAHDVPIDTIQPDPFLREALLRLPGRRLIFTNADLAHTERVLARIGISDLFDDLFHIEMADYVPKPSAATFMRMIDHHVLSCPSTCFFEDSERNLAPAHVLGMTTVLVGPNALESQAGFVHHRTADLTGFLNAATVLTDEDDR